MPTKILIINDYSINNEDAVGITLRSFFNNDCFEVRDFYRMDKNIEKDSIFISYKVPNNVNLIDSHLRKNRNRISKNEMANLSKTTFVGKIKNTVKFISENFLFLPQNSSFLREITEYNPDYIYTIGGSLYSLKLSYLISKKIKKPLIIHYMDNWIETLYKDNPIINRFWKREVKKITHYAHKVLVISQKMKVNYEVYFERKNMYTLFNVSDELSIEKNYQKIKNSINISYIGGLHLNRYKKILEIEKVIKDRFNSYNIRLNIYTNSNINDDIINKFDCQITHFHPQLRHDDISEAYSDTDILLHVEADDEDTILYTKYSLSTKISEYLFSGLPIIYFGPANLSVAEFLMENRLAKVASNKEDFQNFLQQFIDDEDLRISFGGKGKIFATKNLSRKKAEQVLNSVFKD
ncbi:hypothetical protein P7E30_01355 [Enterococcus gallinarum]|uniref:Spore protein YkvP/CgeB glycosyl transferase-like domain-containing protein n=2 Tax=Enterococcus TaxID=1350 RepID=A0AAE4KW36_ENTGA|nr:hypothetical protein [Enterococcus gallinarum]MBO6331574.1 hypothetical protein [Enterococcus gallinarum]MBO6351909.1 hypothetical protein [Enterococcus gallinarum]MBO6393430.1 hypothetical protein [Enterococcus gallinarum]MBO6424838.1 hypothetical protein [Enterococcus gallinarum]MCO5475389.1 hypothetical protein [Enterococcus gallinarum]